MTKLSHKQKVKMARKMRSPKENVSIFSSSEWEKRKAAILKRVSKSEIKPTMIGIMVKNKSWGNRVLNLFKRLWPRKK